MCYGAESAWLPALMEALAAAGEGAATAEGVAAGTAAAGTAAAGATAGAGAGAMTAAEMAKLAQISPGLLAPLEATASVSAPGLLTEAPAIQSAAQGLLSAAPEISPYVPVREAIQASGTPVRDASTKANLWDQMRFSGGGASSGAGGNASKMMLAQMGMGMLNPPPPQMSGPPPRGGGGGPEQLTMPYGNNSLHGPPPGMTWEEWMRRKQMGRI